MTAPLVRAGLRVEISPTEAALYRPLCSGDLAVKRPEGQLWARLAEVSS